MTIGGTEGTPITGGIGSGLSIAEPIPSTWLTLSRYAKIMGIPPLHFFGAQASTAFPISGGCAQAWARHSWQNLNNASREEIAIAIDQVEQEISEYIGFNLGPAYILNEVHEYPQHYATTGLSLMGGIDSRGLRKGIHLRDGGKLIQTGSRATTLIDTATTAGGSLAYTDEDGDGFAETATVTVTTTVTDPREIKAFVTNTSAQPEWEIRYPLSVQISGGVATMRFNSWLFIDPDLDAAYPTADSYRALDVSTTANYVSSVDIYRVYVDNTAVSARFFWERDGACTTCGGTGCDACSLSYQDGCSYVGDVDLGIIVPFPAEYSADDGLWVSASFAYTREPDQVRVSYYAGDLSQQYIAGTTQDPLKAVYARAIAYMATARISRPACTCPDLADNFSAMREDLSAVGGEVSHIISQSMLENPFGTRRGEVMAWNLIGKISREQRVEVAII